jgi:hypothetical protein
MSLSIGIVGLPNVGKSTLFQALTKKQVDISNYPFCTIDPNVGVVKVPDKRLEQLTAGLKPKEVLPTTIEFVDIAGLVKNAHQGEGLGNQFLGHIREVDAIALLLRDFKDANVSHVYAEVNPEEDKETIELELIMADLGTVTKRLEKLEKEAKSGDKEAEQKKAVVEKIKTTLEKGEPISRDGLSEDEQGLIKDLNVLTNKPVLYVFNIDNDNPPDLSAFSKKHYAIINAQVEKEASELSPEEQKELGLVSKLDELIKASYELLGIFTFFTVQNNILQAWTTKSGSKAPQAAGKVHKDFEAGFIKAEVINWEKLIEAGSEIAARDKGLIRTEGKEYVVQDGDVCRFLFSK